MMIAHAKVVDAPTDAEREVVNSILREFNRSSNPTFWSALDDPASGSSSVSILFFDEGEQIVGGLFGTTQLNWLKVNVIAVREDVRRQGIGSKLMHVAEDHAKQHGCKYAFVDTMDYQGPRFYLKCGYEVVGTIPDWDSHGHVKYFLTKKLQDVLNTDWEVRGEE